jgi:type IV pilus assembly protein PilW
MTLLLRSPEDMLAPTKTPYTYNATTTTPTDFRVRRIFTSTVTLRNRNG